MALSIRAQPCKALDYRAEQKPDRSQDWTQKHCILMRGILALLQLTLRIGSSGVLSCWGR
eukprot:jgi/Psemu1/49134/gm1.49134_g